MNIVSIDCANKSLAFSRFSVDIGAIVQEYLPDTKPTADKIHEKIRNNFNSLKGKIIAQQCGVISLFPEKVADTNIVYRTKCLKTALDKMDLGDRSTIDAVVIEYQYVAGSHSREVSDCLFMYFATMNTALFFPSSRKKLYFNDDLNYDVFKVKYSKSYSANKAHSIANFKFIIEQLQLTTLQQCVEALPASNHDDIADSFLNAWVWLVKCVIEVQQQPLHNARVAAARKAAADKKEAEKTARIEARAAKVKR